MASDVCTSDWGKRGSHCTKGLNACMEGSEEPNQSRSLHRRGARTQRGTAQGKVTHQVVETAGHATNDRLTKEEIFSDTNQETQETQSVNFNLSALVKLVNEVLKRVVGRDATATLHGSMTAHTHPGPLLFPCTCTSKKRRLIPPGMRKWK
jgi:hypothetical protein